MFDILLAEDNPGDVVLFREVLKGRRLDCRLAVAQDGRQAISMIHACTTGASPVPHLIVLDVNLPKHSGDEVLKVIRGDPVLAGVPVIVLTSSSSPADQAKADMLGANLYIQKPSDLDELLEIGILIERLLKPQA